MKKGIVYGCDNGIVIHPRVHELMALYREDRKMLLNMALKRIVDFHGHLCPDLVLGCKLSEYARRLLCPDGECNGGISVVAENTTSALDAIQVMLGTTVGNQRLQVLDYGKHGYTLFNKNGETGFRASLKKLRYGDEEEYSELERIIMSGQAVLEDVFRFQALQDGRVKVLLGLNPERIFSLEIVERASGAFETPSVLLTCRNCGEPVLESRAVHYEGETFCMPCFRTMGASCASCRLH